MAPPRKYGKPQPTVETTVETVDPVEDARDDQQQDQPVQQDHGASDVTGGDEEQTPSDSPATSATTPPVPADLATPSAAPSNPTPEPPSCVVTHRVCRVFDGGGIVRQPGELVDCTEWRTTRTLEVMRYITPVDSTQTYTTSDGRLWGDLDAAAKHESSLVST